MLIPRLRLDGDDLSKRLNAVFAENVKDILDKVDEGGNGFDRGFIHSSTVRHEGTCYYDQLWTRDGGRGMIELSRLGFIDDVLPVVRYLLGHITFGDHWGRVVNITRYGLNELDGEAYILLGLYNAYKASGFNRNIGLEILESISPVIDWVEKECAKSPYDGLLPSVSELSGNPNTPYPVYSVFGNYAIAFAMHGLYEMASKQGNTSVSVKTLHLYRKILNAVSKLLISDGRRSKAPEGVWFNGIDGRDGRPYEQAEWDKAFFPIYHWTRQLPFVTAADIGIYGMDTLEYRETHEKSYEYILDRMAESPYFTKYGFVSNTCWTGMCGRHDDTMGGYGQGFFTQAALMMDDVNTYSKCLEGVARLAYDGNVVKPLAHEMNPWVLHECFNYENYEKGLDHTFGALSLGRREVMNNPGEEGNMVQVAENVKSLSMMIGIRAEGNVLVIAPRLSWLAEGIEVMDYPVNLPGGGMGRVSFSYANKRWLRQAEIEIDAPEEFASVAVRFGPFPLYIKGIENKGMEIARSKNATWIWKRNLSPRGKHVVSLW